MRSFSVRLTGRNLSCRTWRDTVTSFVYFIMEMLPWVVSCDTIPEEV